MRISESQMIGVAGQFLTCTDLLMKGLVAYPACEGLPYDVVLDRKDIMLKVQVKTCRSSQQPGNNKKLAGWYNYNLVGSSGKKRNEGKLGSSFNYQSDEVDIFALVALDIMKVGYILRWGAKRTNYRFCDDNTSSPYYVNCMRDRYTKACEMKDKGLSYEKIADRLGISVNSVKYTLKRGLPSRESVYFSSILRDANWFWNIKMPPSWGMGVRRVIWQ